MELFPAIDLKNNRCVRLLRGDMDSAVPFNDNPGDQARAFAAGGCSWLHLVDLDGAVSGRPVNAAGVAAVLATSGLRVQLGGGIRDARAIDAWLDAGVARVVLGTLAVRDPALVRAACARHPGRIVVAIDARDGRVMIEGWTEASALEAPVLARRFVDAGAAAIVYTDIERDGALAGVNIPATVEIAGAGIPVIASGGVASLDDLRALAAAGIAGVIVGRAFYEGRFGVAEALAALEE